MAKVKTLKEKQKDGTYTKVYPITCTSAVIDSDGKSIDTIIGSMSSLETDEKSSIVDAINELNDMWEDIEDPE